MKESGVPLENCKIDVTTEKNKKKRGDIWISKEERNSKKFESSITALVEAKHRNTTIGDADWRDAMNQGKEKSQKQRLNYYGVTNCRSDIRFYNAFNDEEIILDGKTLSKMVSIEILNKIQSQSSNTNSFIIHKISKITKPLSEAEFRTTLGKLADIYRSAGLKKGDERIDPTVGFVVMRYISDVESKERTLAPVINLWDNFRKIADEEVVGDLGVEFRKTVELIWDKESHYKDNIYQDFKDLVSFSNKLSNNHFKKIFHELDHFHFYGANFDLYGAIYEEFASQTKKKEFGEFYTRRHITSVVSRLLLRNEIAPRNLRICDPACGTGGFLTEAYKALINNYSANGKLNDTSIKQLKRETFWGFDNDPKSVARTKLNMFLVGDGHMHIYDIDDSLIGWNEENGWKENEFDYIMTNPPMGTYEGDARIEDFKFTNEQRFELMFAEKVINATKSGGEIAIVLNDGALEAPTREEFRKKILENCDIHAIISLTTFAFAPYTKEKTYVIFMQKKQNDDIRKIQEFPIWHFIVDYDGHANSDKRYKTKYHDDLPELEIKFSNALKCGKMSITNRREFERNRNEFERRSNQREKEEGISGMKYGYVDMNQINEDNFHNLLSEFYLRPLTMDKITEKEFDNRIASIMDKFAS